MDKRKTRRKDEQRSSRLPPLRRAASRLRGASIRGLKRNKSGEAPPDLMVDATFTCATLFKHVGSLLRPSSVACLEHTCKSYRVAAGISDLWANGGPLAAQVELRIPFEGFTLPPRSRREWENIYDIVFLFVSDDHNDTYASSMMWMCEDKPVPYKDARFSWSAASSAFCNSLGSALSPTVKGGATDGRGQRHRR